MITALHAVHIGLTKSLMTCCMTRITHDTRHAHLLTSGQLARTADSKSFTPKNGQLCRSTLETCHYLFNAVTSPLFRVQEHPLVIGRNKM